MSVLAQPWSPYAEQLSDHFSFWRAAQLRRLSCYSPYTKNTTFDSTPSVER